MGVGVLIVLLFCNSVLIVFLLVFVIIILMEFLFVVLYFICGYLYGV